MLGGVRCLLISVLIVVFGEIFMARISSSCQRKSVMVGGVWNGFLLGKMRGEVVRTCTQSTPILPRQLSQGIEDEQFLHDDRGIWLQTFVHIAGWEEQLTSPFVAISSVNCQTHSNSEFVVFGWV